MPSDYIETAGGVSPPIAAPVVDPNSKDDDLRKGKRKSMERSKRKMRKGKRY